MAYERIFHLLGHICHQHPEQSFVVFGAQLPLCARCTGIYTALVTSLLIGFAYLFMKRSLVICNQQFMRILIALSFAMALNFGMRYVVRDNLLHLVLGAVLGCSIGLTITISISEIQQKNIRKKL